MMNTHARKFISEQSKRGRRQRSISMMQHKETITEKQISDREIKQSKREIQDFEDLYFSGNEKYVSDR